MKSIRLIVLCILAAASCLVYGSDTKHRTPFDYEFLTYAWVMGLAAFGGVVNFSRKMREGAVRAFNLTEFIGEIVTSAFAGLLTFWLTEAADMDKLVSAVLIAVSGHMGSRAIFMIEKALQRKVESKVQ
jgi:hypothetical protein